MPSCSLVEDGEAFWVPLWVCPWEAEPFGGLWVPVLTTSPHIHVPCSLSCSLASPHSTCSITLSSIMSLHPVLSEWVCSSVRALQANILNELGSWRKPGFARPELNFQLSCSVTLSNKICPESFYRCLNGCRHLCCVSTTLIQAPRVLTECSPCSNLWCII